MGTNQGSEAHQVCIREIAKEGGNNNSLAYVYCYLHAHISHCNKDARAIAW